MILHPEAAAKRPSITIGPMDKLGVTDAQFKAIARDNALRLFPKLRA